MACGLDIEHATVMATVWGRYKKGHFCRHMFVLGLSLKKHTPYFCALELIYKIENYEVTSMPVSALTRRC